MRRVFSSTKGALDTIANYSTNAALSKNARNMVAIVEEGLTKIANLTDDTPVNHTNPSNFCLSTRVIESVCQEDPVIKAAIVIHHATLQAAKKLLDAQPGTKVSWPTDKPKTAPRTNWGLIFGISGVAIFGATLIYIVATRKRVSLLPASR